MAGEQQVLEAVLGVLGEAQLPEERVQLLYAWLAADLPIEPSEGAVGVAQLEIAVGRIDRLANELSSLGKLGLIWTDGVRFVGNMEDPLLGSRNVPDGGLVIDSRANEAAFALHDTARTIERFLTDGDG